MIETSGAPFAQGHAQGRALHAHIDQVARRLRRQYGFASWRLVLSEVHFGVGRRVQRFLPQQHERLEGIAAGARVHVRALELFDNLSRVDGVGSVQGCELEARLELSPELEALLTLRRSLPDACGFPSVELTCAPWVGCLAGVNDQGIGVAVVEDHDPAGPSIRVLAQDFVYRAQQLEAGIEHLRLRAGYAGISGVLLVVDGCGLARRLRLRRGELEIEELTPISAQVRESTLRIDAAARTLQWSAPDGDRKVEAALNDEEAGPS
jgi:hypothetical protein